MISDVLGRGLGTRDSTLEVTTLCKISHTREWNSQSPVERAAKLKLFLSGAILFSAEYVFSRLRDGLFTGKTSTSLLL